MDTTPVELRSINSPGYLSDQTLTSANETWVADAKHLKKRTLKDDEQEHTKELSEAMYRSEKDPHDFPDGGKEANLALFGSFVGLVADFGIANSLGAIESYVSSHQLEHVKDTSVSWVFTLHLGVMYFGGVFFGELFDRFGARKLLVASTIFMAVGLFTTAESTKLSHFILSFGITTAIGTSLGMVPLIGVISHWFLRKRALASSIATIGGLIGSSVFAVMLQHLYAQIGFKWSIRVLAFVCIGCMTVAIIFTKERKVEEQAKTELSQIETCIDERITPPKKGNSIVHFFKSAMDMSILRESKFISLSLAVFCAEIISMTSLTYLTSYGLDHGISSSNAYLLITLVNVCGIPSRLLSGVFADMYGRFNVMIVMSALTAVVIFAMWLPAKGDLGMLFAFSVLFGVSTSASISLIPATTSQICSADRFGKVYGTLYFVLAFLTILGMYFTSVVLGQRSQQDYRNFILYEGGLSIAAIILWIVARYCSVGMKWCKF